MFELPLFNIAFFNVKTIMLTSSKAFDYQIRYLCRNKSILTRLQTILYCNFKQGLKKFQFFDNFRKPLVFDYQLSTNSGLRPQKVAGPYHRQKLEDGVRQSVRLVFCPFDYLSSKSVDLHQPRMLKFLCSRPLSTS